MESLLIIPGFIFLLGGAELLLRSSVGFAKRFGISTFVIGLTLVAYGTSFPELLVCLVAALKSKTEMVFGNAIGSNIFNIAFVLGLTALIRPVAVNKKIFDLSLPICIILGIVLPVMLLDGVLGRIDGTILTFVAIVFTYLNVRKKSEKMSDSHVTVRIKSIPLLLILFILGIFGLTFGADWLVDGATFLANKFDVSQRVIGLTIVAIGTSLPELATSLVAAIRGESDISVGNIVGSNIFNIAFILGVVALISPVTIPEGSIPSGLLIDLILMGVLQFLLWPSMRKRLIVGRVVGGLYLLMYAGYMYYLFCN